MNKRQKAWSDLRTLVSDANNKGEPARISLKEEFEAGDVEYRVCDVCGAIMIEGFVIENGLEYYCSAQCLHTEITEAEYLELYDEGNGDSYWTQWECQEVAV